MYTTSWGLHTTWSKLVETALVWRDVRTFRLVRLRHATELAAGAESHFNLASLPSEILRMIEDEIMRSARRRVRLEAPLFFDDDCCVDSFLECEPYWEALDIYAILNGYDLDDQVAFNAAASAFEGTEEAEALRDQHWQVHLQSGQCLALAKSSEFWPFLASGKHYEEAEFDLEAQVCQDVLAKYVHAQHPHECLDLQLLDAEEVVETFVADFNLQLHRRAYGK